MSALHNLNTRKKLVVVLVVMMLFLAIVTAVGLVAMQTISRAKDAVTDLTALTNDVNMERMGIMARMLVSTEEDKKTWHDSIEQRALETYQVIGRLGNYFTRPAESDKIKQIETTLKDYDNARQDVYVRIDSHEMEEAKNVIFHPQTERYNHIAKLAGELQSVAAREAAYQIKMSKIIFLICLGLALLAAAIMVWWLERVIATPLREVTGLANKIASGDLNVDLTSVNGRKDEVGQLTAEFSRMVRSLNKTAQVAERISQGDLTAKITPQSERDVLGNAFATMIVSLQRLTADITQGVNVLGSSATEILASTSQVVSSATETATAVTETTATVEEVKQTAQVASQKARYVAESAQKSAQVSQAGQQAVEDTIEGTHRIRQQMESIAESIIKLSEQSHAIGELIASVNDLAEQSNLLAVNASIEAAKAGDHGKGFAVVAQEVKSLAEQSKGATAQVRSILSDIQKATSAAVMATEQGSKAVEAALRLSAEAGESISVMAASIGDSAQAAAQIAASGQEQLVGMDQVALAMQSINDASTQNVSAMEQLKSAAQNLSDLGHDLKTVVDQYRI